MLVREVAQAVGDVVDDAMDEMGDFAGHGLGASSACDAGRSAGGRRCHGRGWSCSSRRGARDAADADAAEGALPGGATGRRVRCCARAHWKAAEAPARRRRRRWKRPARRRRSLAYLQRRRDTALAAGMLEAAEASGQEALLEVREALPAELAGLGDVTPEEA